MRVFLFLLRDIKCSPFKKIPNVLLSRGEQFEELSTDIRSCYSNKMFTLHAHDPHAHCLPLPLLPPLLFFLIHISCQTGGQTPVQGPPAKSPGLRLAPTRLGPASSVGKAHLGREEGPLFLQQFRHRQKRFGSERCRYETLASSHPITDISLVVSPISVFEGALTPVKCSLTREM